MKTKYYVTMTDKFMSGWGRARDKINKLVIECNGSMEAVTVAVNAKDRPEMKYINIRETKPYYNQERYETSWHDRGDYSRWFRDDRPFRR